MESISQYHFHKTKYGTALLIDVVELKNIKKYLQQESIHSLTYYDITFITSGEGNFYIDMDRYAAKPNDVIFSRPGEVRSWDIATIGDGYALIFEEEFLLSFFNDSDFINDLAYFSFDRYTAKITLTDKLSIKVSCLIRDVKQEINNISQKKDNHLLRALLYEILILLHREYVNEYNNFSRQVRNRYVDRFLKLLNVNYISYQSTSYYAAKLCLTPNYLNELVKSATGRSVKDNIHDKVLLESKRLLIYSSLSITEIAEKLNFSNSSYFIRFFRHKTGMTPLKYRNTYKF